ncbi:MAG: phosphoglucosamine mutase [Duodenibacillus sp.]|nr:phosphoglucosamine mutase [Duodenibacillus sp.]
MTERKYFGTDGIRGTVGAYPITPDFVLKLGQAAGRVLRRERRIGPARVLIGKDPRISGYMLEAALQAGFASAGVWVMQCGPIPTPGVAYLTRAVRYDMGVVISASHNPYHDNGIKFFSASGTKLPDAMELEIEAEIEKGFACEASDGLGRVRRLDDARGRYIEFCKSTFPMGLDLKGMRLYLDCANGASYHIAPAVFAELGAEVVCDGVEPDGYNINKGCGATCTKDLAERTARAGCELGLAFDGDADRLIMADARRVYNGDELLYALVKDKARTQPVAGVAGTLMTNYGLEKRLAEMGIAFARAKVGDRYVMETLKERGWLYGGESSGHIIALDKQTTGDGIVSALQVLAALRSQGVTLASLVSDLVMMPQALVNRRIPKGYDWKGDADFAEAVQKAAASLAGRGRVLVRPSGTEPLLRIMVECDDAQAAHELAQGLAAALSC